MRITTFTYRESRKGMLADIGFERRQAEVFSREHALFNRPDVVAQCLQRVKHIQRQLAELRRYERYASPRCYL